MGAIATTFDGIEYRSRLEARWAAFMHNIGWDHTYEPIDGDGYIPDFIVHGDSPFFVEVKPAITVTDFTKEQSKVERGLRDLDYDVIVVGVSPFNTGAGFADGHTSVSAGWMNNEGDWAPADWITCGFCNRIAVAHTTMSFHGRPCSHADGDHFLHFPPLRFLEGCWSDACNEVKWRGRSA